MNVLVHRLRSLRLTSNLTEARLAGLLCVSESDVRAWEAGCALPDEEALVRYADLFDMSLDYLFGRTDKPEGVLYGGHFGVVQTVTAPENRLTAEQDRVTSKQEDNRPEHEKTLDKQDKARSEQSGGFNKYASPTEKIALFRALFCGREDVFARRWASASTGKSGYQPVCGNEWAEGVCDKKQYRCAACPNRALLPLTDADIYKHLEGKDPHGRDVVGIYPLLPDNACRFLCADFDEADYEQDVTVFREVCAAHGVPVCIERSRSGNGAHAWIFFDSPVPASTARRLGSGLLSRAMERRSEVSFKSYDRFFPNQDTIPDGGFGNLVALPLQGLARKSGNSVFVDERFTPYPDQWSYLAGVIRITADCVSELAAELCGGGELGPLVSESDEKPWETKKKTALSQADFPVGLSYVRANLLYIPTDGLSSAAKNRVKRLAAFGNPDFYRAQAMRMPIHDKPRIISTAELTDGYIGLPRGCEEALCGLLDEANVPYQVEDKRNAGMPLSVTFNGTLREEQQPAADALLAHDTGVLSATTAFGKTVIASYLIAARQVNTLVLVHTQALLTQWKKSLEQFLTIDGIQPEEKHGRGRRAAWSPVGTLCAGKNTLHGAVDVAVMQSLTDGDEVKKLVRNYGMVIVDECHHVSAVQFEKILRYANARYVYGLTATPTRQDGHHPIIFMQCGPIRYRVNAREQAEKRAFDHCLIPRFTSYRTSDPAIPITALFRDLSESARRNQQIVQDAAEALAAGRSPIILTERREHVSLLSELLAPYCTNVIQLTGTASAPERRAVMQRLEAVPPDEPLVIVATGRYVGEGFDCPRLDTLLLAMPIAWKGKVAQYAGRLHRSYAGKTEVQVFDYVDVRVPVLERMYQKRLKSYASIGYKVKAQTTEAITPDIIYDGKSFQPIYRQDVEAAERSVLIVSPFMRRNRLNQLVKLLSACVLRDVSVTVITRPPEDFPEKDRDTVTENADLLTQYGVRVCFKSDFHQKFTVIDSRTVWYGSVNFLSFGTNEESIMRFEHEEVAGELESTV